MCNDDGYSELLYNVSGNFLDATDLHNSVTNKYKGRSVKEVEKMLQASLEFVSNNAGHPVCVYTTNLCDTPSQLGTLVVASPRQQAKQRIIADLVAKTANSSGNNTGPEIVINTVSCNGAVVEKTRPLSGKEIDIALANDLDIKYNFLNEKGITDHLNWLIANESSKNETTVKTTSDDDACTTEDSATNNGLPSGYDRFFTTDRILPLKDEISQMAVSRPYDAKYMPYWFSSQKRTELMAHLINSDFLKSPTEVFTTRLPHAIKCVYTEMRCEEQDCVCTVVNEVGKRGLIALPSLLFEVDTILNADQLMHEKVMRLCQTFYFAVSKMQSPEQKGMDWPETERLLTGKSNFSSGATKLVGMSYGNHQQYGVFENVATFTQCMACLMKSNNEIFNGNPLTTITKDTERLLSDETEFPEYCGFSKPIISLIPSAPLSVVGLSDKYKCFGTFPMQVDMCSITADKGWQFDVPAILRDYLEE